jgi:hypothetical protein
MAENNGILQKLSQAITSKLGGQVHELASNKDG